MAVRDALNSCVHVPAFKTTMASPAPQTYSSLRADIRHQEAQTDVALGELSALSNGSPSQYDIEVEERLARIFRERHETVDALARIVETDPSAASTRVHQVTRAREMLAEHEREFRRMKVPFHAHTPHKGILLILISP